MLDLREHKRTPDRLSDVLPWAALIAPEVVLNKDGSFQATIRYRGPDLDSSTPEELVVKSAHVNDILRRLGSGWAIFAEAQRNVTTDYPSSSFPEPLTALIDELRREEFANETQYDSTYFLTLVYLPPSEGTNRVGSLFVDSGAEPRANYPRLVENFKADVQRVRDLLGRVFPLAEVLTRGDLLTYLHSTVSPKRHRVMLPETAMYLDGLLADSPLLGGFQPRLGEYYVGVIGIQGFPGASQPGLLDALNRLPIAYRWVTRFICLDKGAAKREIEAFQRKWFAKRKGLGALVREILTKEESALSDSDALQKAQDAQAALVEIGSEDVSYGYLTTTISLLGRTREELADLATEVEAVVNGAGFTTRRESVNAVEAWLGSIPGNTQRNVRRPILNTMNLAHLLPGASAVWGGQTENAYLSGPPLLVAHTGGSTPFRLSLHVGDVGHTLILGPTGSGKSTLLGLIEAQFLRYPGAQVYIFDKGGSSQTLTAGVGGFYYDLGADDAPLFFQPLAFVDDPDERVWAHDWLVAIAQRENVVITPEVKRAIWDALASLAATPKEQRTIHTLTVYLQNIELRAAFEPFTQNGPYGRFLDHSHDTLFLARWQSFEMARLMETPAVVAPILAYIFHRLNQRFTGAPTLVVLDEAWLFLDHPIFATKIREWLKTLRKLNVSVLFATQSLADVDESPIAATVREACFTKIYLPNAIALQPDVAEIYRRFGLNDRQIELLAYSVPKRDYYYTSALGNRVFDLGLDEVALAYCSGVSREQQELVQRLLSTTDSTLQFNVEYLRHKGLDWAAEYLQRAESVRRAA